MLCYKLCLTLVLPYALTGKFMLEKSKVFWRLFYSTIFLNFLENSVLSGWIHFLLYLFIVNKFTFF